MRGEGEEGRGEEMGEGAGLGREENRGRERGGRGEDFIHMSNCK